jgi:hypothetical protein
MADDSDVSVRFGADTAGIEQGAKTAGDAIADFGSGFASIAEAIQAQTVEINAALASMSEQMAASMEAAAEATAHEEEEMDSLIGTMREGVAQVAEMKESFMGAGEAIMAFFAVEEIVDWAKEMAEASEHAEQLGQRLGMTTAAVQAWQAVAVETGRSADQFAMAMTRLTDAGVKAAQGSKGQEAAFKDLGISAQDAIDPQNLMLEIADKYAAMGEGSAQSARKIADAMVLMGRSGADMIPILDKGRAGIEAMMEKGAEYGTVVDASVNKANVEAAEKLNDLKLAFAGLSETVFSEIVPALTSFVEGTTELVVEMSHAVGGSDGFKEAMHDLQIIVAGVGAALVTFATVSLATTVVETLAASNAFRALAGAIAIEAEMSGMAGVMRVLGGVLLDIATGAIPAAIAGLEALTAAMFANPATALAIAIGLLTAGIYALSMAQTDAKKATDDLASSKKLLETDTENVAAMTDREYAAHIRNAQGLISDTEETLKNLQAKRALAAQRLEDSAKSAGPENLDGHIGMGSAGQLRTAGDRNELNGVDDAIKAQLQVLATRKADLLALVNAPVEPTGGVLRKGPEKEKKQKDDTVSQWQEQLKQKQDDQANWYVDQNTLAANFWAGIVAKGQGSVTDQRTAQDSLAEAMKALDAEGVERATETAKKKAALAGSNVDQVKAIYADLEATLARTDQEGGTAWQKIQDDKVDAVKKAVAEMRAEQVKLIADQAKGERSDAQTQGTVGGLKIQGQEQAVKSQASMGQIKPDEEMSQLQALAAQKIALETQTQNTIYGIDLAALYRTRDANGTTPGQAELINGQIKSLQQAHYGQMDVMAQQSTNLIAQDAQAKALQAQQHWMSMISPVTSGFASMTEGMLHGTETFGQGFMKILDSMLDKFIEFEFTSLAHHLASQASQTAATAGGVTARVAVEQTGHTTSLLMDMQATLIKITNAAAAAAASAYQAFAAIPIIGPELGAAAAAATFVVVEGYGALASASGGYDIGNENPMTQLHAQEMVLPSSIANPLRNMISAGAGGSSGGSSGGGGSPGRPISVAFHSLDSRDVKAHFNTPQGKAAVQRMLKDHS